MGKAHFGIKKQKHPYRPNFQVVAVVHKAEAQAQPHSQIESTQSIIKPVGLTSKFRNGLLLLFLLMQLKTGVVQSECSGTMVVPTDSGLVKGQAYYARVFAYSPVGFSQGQVGLV